MNVLEKILEEILQYRKDNNLLAGKQVVEIERIIRSHMDEVENDDWISVEERLPEIGKSDFYDMNLVTLEDGEVCLGVYRNKDDEWWTRRQQRELRYTNKHDVIAWQPLPEPYKPEESKPAKNTQQEIEDFWNDK